MPALASGALEALYREVVLEHYRRPRNREPLRHPDAVATVPNPVCGDQVRVEVRLAGESIAEVSARARGCSIAVASGSVMTELLEGADAARAARLRGVLEGLLAGGEPAAEIDPRLRAFAAIAPLASRHACVLLAWEALEQALREARAGAHEAEP